MNAELSLQKVEEFLDSYEKKIGLEGIVSSDVVQYLTLNQDQLRKLSAEECAEAAYLLNQEALYVQHEINKFNGQINWANRKIDNEIAGKVQEYGTRYTEKEHRRILAIRDNTAATELQKIVDKANNIVTRISYVPTHLRNLASVLLDYRFSKVRSMKDEATRTS